MERRVERVVVDANIAVALVLPLPYAEVADIKMQGWRSVGVELYAPLLWEYEVVSALRKAVVAGQETEEGAARAIDYLLGISVKRVEPGPDLHREALRWAGRLGQVVAYDAQYLALAAQLGAEFWTADRRLAARAHEVGATWVRSLSAPEGK